MDLIADRVGISSYNRQQSSLAFDQVAIRGLTAMTGVSVALPSLGSRTKSGIQGYALASGSAHSVGGYFHGTNYQSDQNVVGVHASATQGYEGTGKAFAILCGNGMVYVDEKLSIGGTNYDPGAKLHIEGGTDAVLATAASGYFIIGDTDSLNICMDNNEIMARSNGSTSTLHLQAEGGGLKMGAGGFGVNVTPSTTAGHIRAGNDIVAFYSDERLKENVGSIENAVEKIKSIDTLLYKHNDLANSFGFTGNKIHIGVGAQSVKKTVPQAVEIAPFDADGEGNSKSGEDYLTVQYERLVPLLIEGIKEQQEQIDDLKQELKEIKNGSS